MRGRRWWNLGLGLLLALAAAGAMAANGNGRFKVLAPEVQSRELRELAREMHASGSLQELANALNQIFYLPTDVGLGFAECEESNAYYDPENRRILLCLELMQGMAETLEGQFEDEETTLEALAGAFVAVALHEVGHALVDVLEIPVTGREEDAVDQLAAWMLIEADDVDSVLGAAATYYTDNEVGDEDFSDEHSLDKQRYFNMVCWAYGSDPDNSQELIDDWELPEARAEGCAEEYALLDRSWNRLLKDHLRPEAASVGSPTVALPTTRLPAPDASADDEEEDEDYEEPGYAGDAEESEEGEVIEISVRKGGNTPGKAIEGSKRD